MKKHIFNMSYIIFLTIFMSACSGGKLMNIASISESQKEKLDIVFDNQFDLKADFYFAPKKTAASKNATVIFVYGGSWRIGGRKQYQFVADALNQAHYNVVIPDYRLFPETAYPGFIKDVETFMLWLNKHAAKLNINTEQIILMGHSAGAYNSAMYLFDSAYKKPFSFSGFIGLAGPYDFFLPTIDEKLKPVFSKNDPRYNSKSELPVNTHTENLEKVVKAVFIANGEKDKLVTPKNIDSMKQYLAQYPIPVKAKLYSDKNHVQLIAGINNVPFFGGSLKDDVITFMDSVTAQ